MRKYLVISLLASYSIVFAGESEDFKAVDNLYKERNFKAALVESEKFLQKYPESKHQKSMRDKVAKIYFLEKNYKKAEEIFKKLYTIEEKQSQKDEYASYLARANALLNNSDSAIFYAREIKDKKTFQKTFFAVAQNFLAKENNEAAQKAYKEIIDNKYENYKESMMGLGIVYYNLKDYDKAIYWLSEYSKEMPKEQYPLAKAYALSEGQEFDNYNADWGNSEYDKIKAYKDLKQNFSEEVIKAVEKMVDDNTYTQSKNENKVYVTNIAAIIDKIEQQQTQNLHPDRELTEKQSNQLNYLKSQVKYLGLGEDTKLHKELENAILSPEAKVTIRAEYNYPDRLMKGNTVLFDLNLTKTEQGGVFLNSYRANLTTKNGEERSQTFKVQKENNITAKEAINLLEGRSVKIDHDVVDKETGELSRTESFIKLNMKEPKTDYGNYKYEWYNKNAYGVDIDNIMQKSNLTFANDIERERTKKHLEKGNITQVTFQQENRQIQGFAVLNPQWKMLNLYDNAMNRVTIQNQLVKPEVTQSQQKNNVPEHSISR